MYRNEDEFVRGQKVQLLIMGLIFLFLLIRHLVNGEPILK